MIGTNAFKVATDKHACHRGWAVGGEDFILENWPRYDDTAVYNAHNV